MWTVDEVDAEDRQDGKDSIQQQNQSPLLKKRLRSVRRPLWIFKHSEPSAFCPCNWQLNHLAYGELVSAAFGSRSQSSTLVNIIHSSEPPCCSRPLITGSSLAAANYLRSLVRGSYLSQRCVNWLKHIFRSCWLSKCLRDFHLRVSWSSVWGEFVLQERRKQELFMLLKFDWK